MPKECEKYLRAAAARRGLKGRALAAFIYGGMKKLGYKARKKPKK